jgi:predicted tellurium resistance membrane protein TerC
MVTRILLLFSITAIIRMTEPLIVIVGNEISGRDIVLIVGGLFLLAKSTHEIHVKLEGSEGSAARSVPAAFSTVIVQIMLLDIVFSLDSVITAVGMVDEIPIMVTAVVLAVGVMFVFADAVSGFVEQHPTVKILALSFLMLIGFALVADGLDLHIPKGYIYFAMAFSLGVEMVNLRLRKSTQPAVELRSPYQRTEDNASPPSV